MVPHTIIIHFYKELTQSYTEIPQSYTEKKKIDSLKMNDFYYALWSSVLPL
jgi:hypothetical protein